MVALSILVFHTHGRVSLAGHTPPFPSMLRQGASDSMLEPCPYIENSKLVHQHSTGLDSPTNLSKPWRHGDARIYM